MSEFQPDLQSKSRESHEAQPLEGQIEYIFTGPVLDLDGMTEKERNEGLFESARLVMSSPYKPYGAELTAWRLIITKRADDEIDPDQATQKL